MTTKNFLNFNFHNIWLFLLFLGISFSCSEENLEPDTSLLPAEVKTAAAGDAIAIVNPGFESNWDGWNDVDPSAISGDSNSGSNSAKISGSGGEFTQVVSVTPNTDYSLSAYVKGSWRIGAEAGSNRTTRSGNASDWKKETVTFNSGSSSSITILGEYRSGEGRFDDFTLIQNGTVGTVGNIALSGTASQSSTLSAQGAASKAIDGNTNGAWSGESVTHTASSGDANPWWKVDLGSTKNIGEIKIYNRTDGCCKWRLDNITVTVENTSGSIIWSENVTSSSASQLSVDAEGAAGRVVKIYQNGTAALSLAEVEIFEGEENVVCSFGSSAIPSGNLAYGKSTSQSSLYTGNGGESCKAVDGNTSGNWNNGSITHTQSQSQPWWEVDLGSNQSIGDIVLYNRTNCCSSRLSNFNVSVINSGGSTTFSETIGSLSSSSIVIDADGATGSTIRVQLNGSGVLSLAEVQVFEFEDTSGPGNLDPNKAPSENFDLSKWKLTLTSAAEITTENLNNGYQLSNQFYTNTSDGGMVFKNYPGGSDVGTTSEATQYSRVEFREMLRGTKDWWEANMEGDFGSYPDTKGINKNNWVFSTSSSSNRSKAGGVDGVMNATLAVNRVTQTSEKSIKLGRVVVGQIHASENEPCRLYYHKQPGHSNGAIYFGYEPNSGDEVFYTILGSNYVNSGGDYKGAGNPSDGIELNKKWGYQIKVVGNTLTVTIYDENGNFLGDKDVPMQNGDLADDYMYFKAGLYSQNELVTQSNDYEQVTFYSLDVSHD